jgi:hypothetical protein
MSLVMDVGDSERGTFGNKDSAYPTAPLRLAAWES